MNPPEISVKNGTMIYVWKNIRGVHHNDEIDPETGYTLPAMITIKDGKKGEQWFFDGLEHRTEKDKITGLTLPAVKKIDGTLKWYKDGYLYRTDRDPETGLLLPTVILADGTMEWYKNIQSGDSDIRHRDEKDPVTGQLLPAIIKPDGTMLYYINGKKVANPNKTLKVLKKFEHKDECWNNDHTIITYQEWNDPEINRDDILMLPDAKEQGKYWCFTRFEIEQWWKGKPKRLHPMLPRRLNEDEKERILQFMNDENFF